MIKAFLALIVFLVTVDFVANHGQATTAAITMASRAGHGFSSSLKDSIFSH